MPYKCLVQSSIQNNQGFGHSNDFNLRSPKPKTIDDLEEMLGPKMIASLKKNQPFQQFTMGGIIAPNYKPEKHRFHRFKNSQQPLGNERVK